MIKYKKMIQWKIINTIKRKKLKLKTQIKMRDKMTHLIQMILNTIVKVKKMAKIMKNQLIVMEKQIIKLLK